MTDISNIKNKDTSLSQVSVLTQYKLHEDLKHEALALIVQNAIIKEIANMSQTRDVINK
jgi:hypothetical protein